MAARRRPDGRHRALCRPVRAGGAAIRRAPPAAEPPRRADVSERAAGARHGTGGGAGPPAEGDLLRRGRIGLGVADGGGEVVWPDPGAAIPQVSLMTSPCLEPG